MKRLLPIFHTMRSKSLLLLLVFACLAQVAAAQPKPPSSLSNPLAQALVGIMVLLAIAIAILGSVVNSAAALFRDKLRKERAAAASADAESAAVKTLFLLIGTSLLSIGAFAQAAPTAAPVSVAADINFNGLSPFAFYLLIAAIAVEIIILIALVYQLKFLVGIESKRVFKPAAEAVSTTPKESWWYRISKAKPLAEEQEIDLSHDYDGISELDNKLPPWWTVAFSITILFSVVYLYRYHVSHSAPLQVEELQIALKKAEAEKAAYLAKSANNVDENSVKMLDADGIAAGKMLFAANCVACHGTAGEGNTVGPNLTDEYWLHGGSIGDVFKSIKYGWVEKGMRSWKDDFSPLQIAQLASYVKSLKGTNPANAKEPQGELYDESKDAVAVDSTAAPIK